jgi:THUMP domain-containing protein
MRAQAGQVALKSLVFERRGERRMMADQMPAIARQHFLAAIGRERRHAALGRHRAGQHQQLVAHERAAPGFAGASQMQIDPEQFAGLGHQPSLLSRRLGPGQTTIAPTGVQAAFLVHKELATLTPGPSLDDYRWLVGAEGRNWLAEVAQAPGELPNVAGRLRKELSAAKVHLLLEQVELRRRGQKKFSAAERMFFTATGLEQATDQWVAAYKASRFPHAAPVADLCCGIGGDLMALAARTHVLGVDRDELAALFARANLDLLQESSASSLQGEVICRDIAEAPLDGIAAWHIDPDRRPKGRRTTRVELHEPGVPAIERLLTICPSGAIKLAPAAELPGRWAEAAELEWISRGGECRQLVVWFGSLAQAPGWRRASVVKPRAGDLASGGRQPPGAQSSSADRVARNAEPDQRAVYQDAVPQDAVPQDAVPQDAAPLGLRSIVGRAGLELSVASDFGRFLAEPDAAVLAANLTGALAAQRHLAAIAPGCVYLTGDQATPDPALVWFEITDVLPFDVKRLKSLLRERRCGRLEIKKRGVPHDPEQVRRQLRVPGDDAATLFITRVRDAVTAIVARRVHNAR